MTTAEPGRVRPRAHAIDLAHLPEHVGLIMDGNGRWAQARGLPRTEGHRAAEDAFADVVEGALELGLRNLTFYAFSTENWRRPPDEVRFLMSFNRDILRRRRDEFAAKGVRFRFIGRRHDRRVPRRLVSMADETEAMTAENRRLTLYFALNYGGRAELVDAVKDIARLAAEGRLDPSRITERDIRRHLYDPLMPDPDLIVRTSGEMRTSNFLVWEGAYAELYFTDVLWPDFRREHLREAIAEFQRRSRRFGGIQSSQPGGPS